MPVYTYQVHHDLMRARSDCSNWCNIKNEGMSQRPASWFDDVRKNDDWKNGNQLQDGEREWDFVHAQTESNYFDGVI